MQQAHGSSRDLTRATLSVGAIVALVVSTVWIVRPFVSAFLWATVIVIATWPLFLRLQARLWGKRGMAVALVTVVLLLVLLVPLGFSINALIGNLDGIVAWVSNLDKLVVPPPPTWMAGIPVVGAKMVAAWEHLASQGPDGVTAQVLPYARRLIGWLVVQVGGAGALILQFLLTIIICAVLYANGEAAARGVRKFATRLAGSNGDRAVLLAGGSVRGVAIGVVVTAVVQVLIAGAGLVIASVPGALLLSVVALFLCLAAVGPALVMIPAVIWKFYTGSTLSACILLAFALVSMTIDNVLRPILIRKGADLPLLLILTGVIGGLVGMGIMGIFLGPVILAVTYNLVKEWVETESEPEGDASLMRPENTKAATAGRTTS